MPTGATRCLDWHSAEEERAVSDHGAAIRSSIPGDKPPGPRGHVAHEPRRALILPEPEPDGPPTEPSPSLPVRITAGAAEPRGPAAPEPRRPPNLPEPEPDGPPTEPSPSLPVRITAGAEQQRVKMRQRIPRLGSSRPQTPALDPP